MGQSGTPPLTKLGFQRDVRLFLALLIGLLVVVIAVLLLGLARAAAFGAASTTRQWNTAADAAAESFTADDGEAARAEVVEGRLIFILGRYGIDGASFLARDGRQTTSGTTTGLTRLRRNVRGGVLTLFFDDTALQRTRRTLAMLAVISVAATIGGSVLLFLYLPKITRPVELMLDQARKVSEREAHQDETEFLVDTFRSSVTTLKRQEEELRRLHAAQKSRADDLERVTAALTRSLTSGFLAIDREGRVVDANTAAREILGIGDGPVQGSTIPELCGDNAFSRLIADALERRTPLTRAEAGLTVRDTQRLIGLTTVPLGNEEQAFLGMLALFTDLTPIRELETRVREMQRLADLGEIVAGIAHEFRNSLSTILGYLRLSRRAAAQTQSVEAIEKAEREAIGLSAAVDGLLAFAKPMQLDRRRVDLYDLASSVAERVRVSSGADIRCDGDAATVDGDPVLLDRAVENIVRNAVDSVRRKASQGVVRIHVNGAPGAAIVVEDDGVGVDPSEVPGFFLPFRSGSPNGYGLGLSLANKIVLLHGGTISLTGATGKGAVATIEFPESRPADAGPRV